MQRKCIFSVNEFYHVYNRGNNKSIIFSDDKDYQRFQRLLYLCNGTNHLVFKSVQGLPLAEVKRGEALVDIGAYCLMPNHFHLLLHEKIENGISLFMRKLSTAYSMYRNRKYQRTGALFEGRFRATHIDDDIYLKYLFSYIHLNPVKIIDPHWKENGIANHRAAKNYLAEYSHSSYPDYMGLDRPEKIIINQVSFPEYFTDFKEFENFINEWLSFRQD